MVGHYQGDLIEYQLMYLFDRMNHIVTINQKKKKDNLDKTCLSFPSRSNFEMSKRKERKKKKKIFSHLQIH